MELNCLIVDDDPTFRQFMTAMIEKSKKDLRVDLTLVGKAENAKEADELLKSNEVDIMFLDVRMPEVTGLEYLQTLEETPFVILVSGAREYAVDGFELGVADFLPKPFDIDRFKKSIERVIQQIESNKKSSVLSYNEVTLLKLLQFMYTRQKKKLSPILTNENELGFYYPVLSENFEPAEQIKALKVLELGVERGLLTQEFLERTYQCYNCNNSFLLTREVCPNCDSSHLRSEDLVHHFPCAYVGPVSDFESEEQPGNLICPKCEKTLKHIGVDYDKPSAIYFCLKCGDTFQDVIIKARCTNCNTNMEIENLNSQTIYRYELTRGGEQAATSGFE
ncbi:response regulator [Fodinibius saliphilus]|uniref:TackOD1 domain-containing metal-binding protein n=1 Tax=Fodinibius saliphilus TaxID=1920650 RepID=UPI0011094136|nr:response regulator [Fodinibius saliphilus]